MVVAPCHAKLLFWLNGAEPDVAFIGHHPNLLAWVEAGLPIRTDDDYRARYTARRQAEDFARVFARHAAGAAAP